ncbi:MAG: tetratricopeptide repeat protein [Alphaproteobacteria bacterium]
MKALEHQSQNADSEALLEFFNGELYRYRDKDGDRESAVEAYEQAIGAGTPPTELYRSLGLVLWDLKDHSKAVEAFTQYLSKAPDADDQEMIMSYINELTMGKNEKTIHFYFPNLCRNCVHAILPLGTEAHLNWGRVQR